MKKADTIPTVMDYKNYLDKICKKEGITRDQARDKYGKFTYSQWKKLLKEPEQGETASHDIIQGYQLHDSETEEILGSVFLVSKNENAEDELFEGWEDFNKLEEGEGDKNSVPDFIDWFNKNYETRIGFISLNFIQHK